MKEAEANNMLKKLRLMQADLKRRRKLYFKQLLHQPSSIPETSSKEYYLAQELSNKLRVNIMTIYRYIKAGKLKAFKFGKEFRIEKKEFDRFTRQSVVKP